MRIQVLVRLKAGVLDVQGKAVEHGINGLGYPNVANVRIGRLIEFDLEAESLAKGQSVAKELCEKLLANTVIENYEIREAK